MNNQIQLVLKSSTTELSLNDRELGIYLTPELDGLTGLPEIRTTSGVNAGYDGGWTSAQNYDARSITIRGVIANEDVATVEQLRRQLTTLAGQGKNEELTLDLVTQAGKAYTIQVRTIALEMSLQKVLTQQEFMLQLRADDPLIYDASETGHEALLQVAQATGGFTIDFELPLAITGSSEETVVNNEGLEQVPTITRMYGALHNPKIINQTTNQFMQIEADLGFAEGDWIEPSEVVSGKDITINGAPEGAPLSSVKIDGATSQQTYSGKNLLDSDISNVSQTQNSTAEASGNGIKVTGNSTEGLHYATLKIANIDRILGQQVSISCKYSGTSPRVAIYYVDSSGIATDYLGDLTASSGTASKTITMPGTLGNYDGIALVLYTGTNANATFTDMQIEKSASVTAYEPYTNGPAPNPDYPQDIKTVTGENEVKICGKNLFDPNTPKTHGYLDTKGELYTPGSHNEACYDFMSVEENTTYIFKIFETSDTIDDVYWFGIGAYSSASESGFISMPFRGTTANWSPYVAFTTPQGSKYIRISGRYLLHATKLQLELGSTASSFEPYQGQSYPISLGSIELCKIGDYQDYIYKSGGKWYVRKEVGKLVQNGTETGWYNLSGSTSYARTNAATSFVKNVSFFANRGLTTPTSGTRIKIPNNNLYWYETGYESIEAFKSSLATTNLIVYAPLLTPTDTEITNEALIAQLEALAAATMYNPQTNITTLYAEGNEQPTLDVSYFTDKNPDTRDELVIDSRLRTITLNGLDVYHLQAPGSEFLMLAPGENRLALQSDITGDNGYAQVSYKQGYLSI